MRGYRHRTNFFQTQTARLIVGMRHMEERVIISREEIMTTNYRGLQLLAKRVGVRANTRQDVLRAALLQVSFETPHRPTDENFEESGQYTGEKIFSVCLVVFTMLCLFRFQNRLTIICWGFVTLIVYFAITASVLASIFCCK